MSVPPKTQNSPLIFVDCEATGPCPSVGFLSEFGAVEYETGDTFHGVIVPLEIDPENPAMRLRPKFIDINEHYRWLEWAFCNFDAWLQKHANGSRPIFVSDNPAYDWQWINDGFCRTIARNPFGHSARRIGDFYAGLVNNWRASSRWKRLRITPHDHNPVHDAQGNVEAFRRMLAGERA